MENTIVLTTARLRLRFYADGDESSVFEAFSDPISRRFFPHMQERARSSEWIAWNRQNYETLGFGQWAVESSSDGRFVGGAGLTYQQIEDERWLEVSYYVTSSRRGNGYACEAAAACVSFALTSLHVDKVCSVVSSNNLASAAVARRVHARVRRLEQENEVKLLFHTERS